MDKQETEVFNLVQNIKKEELIKNTLVKIEEIVKENKDKNINDYCFITSKEAWLGIAEYWGVVPSQQTPLGFHGFRIYWHNGFGDTLFFGILYIFEEPSSKFMRKKLEEKLS